MFKITNAIIKTVTINGNMFVLLLSCGCMAVWLSLVLSRSRDTWVNTDDTVWTVCGIAFCVTSSAELFCVKAEKLRSHIFINFNHKINVHKTVPRLVLLLLDFAGGKQYSFCNAFRSAW